MKFRKSILLLTVLMLPVIWLIQGCGSEKSQLLPAWQLVDAKRYRAMGQADPFVSWSPDSKSLIFAEEELYGIVPINIFKWNVGDKKIKAIAQGKSPSFISSDEIIYLKVDKIKKAQGIYKKNINTNEELEIIQNVKKNEFWDDVIGIYYNPSRKTVALSLVERTRFFSPGTEEYSMDGKLLGDVKTRMSDDIVDSSSNPDGSKCAILVQKSEYAPVSLQIAEGKNNYGKELANGGVRSVAWSPDGKYLAYNMNADVVLYNSANGSKITIGKFAANKVDDSRFVSRLAWSPNNKYLAAMVYVPSSAGDYPLIYVLDMSKLKWNN